MRITNELPRCVPAAATRMRLPLKSQVCSLCSESPLAAFDDCACVCSIDTPPVEDAKEAVRIFVDRRPPPPWSPPLLLQNHGREQSESASALPVNTNAGTKEHENTASEAREPAARGTGQQGEDETSFADIDAVFCKQIREIQDLKIDTNDPHRAHVLAEIQRLERERLELIQIEKERLKRVAEEQAASNAIEKQRLHDLAMRLQQEKERRLQEERSRQQLQYKLRTIGRCPAGYAWRKTSNGYVCEGGSHSVSDGQLN
jgi:hypothetical protein